LKKRTDWLQTHDEGTLGEFLAACATIVRRLGANAKDEKKKIGIAGTLEGQTGLRLRKIEALEAIAANTKRGADALVAIQKEVMWIGEAATTMGAFVGASGPKFLQIDSEIAVSMRLSCGSQSLTVCDRNRLKKSRSIWAAFVTTWVVRQPLTPALSLRPRRGPPRMRWRWRSREAQVGGGGNACFYFLFS
jgi:hypothetical protein